MSHVQLSSIAMERLVARRTFPLHKRTSVCRNLFGPVDHDELSRERSVKLREILERDRQRWNFNFEADTPLVGDYQWEEVPSDKAPAFYQGAEVPTPVKQRPEGGVSERLAAPEGSDAAPGEVNQENRADKLNSWRLALPSRAQCGGRKRPTAEDNNTRITDFFVKRKKPAERKSADLNHQPLEQTPTKRIR
ncbi:cyclin-dependent kinase inhibitor 1B-like isoform X1 [Entelurus aequoreus]|uniref:cyclin-dependent kinase inhibitor 1B-like isoform X1 n=2 Tax=Entelurus aequoreus TaxID=161455 RepID=UPI002B1E855A|nr:cyclin-dependent kinase inhibitor 1B-like isoform X1 [Entelurus aequoreus]